MDAQGRWDSRSLKRYLTGEREGAIWAEEASLDEVEALHSLGCFAGAKRLNEFLEGGARVLALCPWGGLTDDGAAQFQDGVIGIGPSKALTSFLVAMIRA
jgi:hypothetical protein